MKTIGYAIVGTGYFGAELGRILNEQEGARVVAVLDPDKMCIRDSSRTAGAPPLRAKVSPSTV